jgi:dihydrodipicolinate synthase/N-acetylneuraminate lyase
VVQGWLKRYAMGSTTKFLLTRFAGLPPVAVRPPLGELTEDQRAELAAMVEAFLRQ